ncbi:extracellular solute-binding protein [Fundicoccus culcitae]|uniref:Extracellular solute-binding protein n=1 Tax=Fundicoccus culcitae TaxID=2969821 RepID=A0ABY5P8H6_9LACT|nr:extracellular solute-binding protein [Fundicoccus culcitae]UUX35047.1 extracellular solute-binding protein [Fundicoccus culcitae]
MKKWLRKFSTVTMATLLATGSLATSVFVSAQEDEEFETGTLTEFPLTEETVHMSLMAPGTGMAEWADMPTLQVYEEMTNISWEYITPPMSDFGTRMNLAFASGDLPDIIYGAGSGTLTRGMEVDYGRQGILIPLEGYLAEYAPNFTALTEENPDILRSITAPDGHIYSLPFLSGGPTGIWPTGPLWYNGAWLDALGVEEVPTTVDDFYDLLVRMRDEDPNGNGQADEIPFTDVALEYSRPYILTAFGMKAFGIEEVDGVVRYAPVTDNYRAYLEFMAKLYSEGLLDQETFIQANEQKKAKGQNNQIGLFQDWFSFFTLGGTEDEAVNNPMFHPLTSEWAPEPISPASPQLQTGVFAITNQAENPELAVQWVDYFYSPDGAAFLNQGPEGAMWIWSENEAGEPVKVFNTENVDITNTEEYRGQITPDYGIPVPKGTFNVAGVHVDPNETDASAFSDFIRDETEAKMQPYAEVPFPVTYLTTDEQDIIVTMQTDLNTFIVEQEARFITGVQEINDDTWAQYVNTINSMGIDDYVMVHQQAYDRWVQAGE